MKISALYFLYNQEFGNIQFPRKKHWVWVNPNCQNSEPTKRTVSIWAYNSAKFGLRGKFQLPLKLLIFVENKNKLKLSSANSKIFAIYKSNTGLTPHLLGICSDQGL